MNPTVTFVEAVRASWRAPAWLPLTEAPTAVTPAIERACIVQLRDYWSRIEAVRLRYDTGALTDEERARVPYSGQRRQAGYYNVEMTPQEREAAWVLYTALIAFIAKIVATAYGRFPMRSETSVLRPTLTMEDCLTESFELWLLTLSAYDEGRGASIPTFTGLDLPSKVVNLIRTHSVEEVPINDDHPERPASSVDIEHLVDFYEWGERLTEDNPRARAIWRGLTGTPG